MLAQIQQQLGALQQDNQSLAQRLTAQDVRASQAEAAPKARPATDLRIGVRELTARRYVEHVRILDEWLQRDTHVGDVTCFAGEPVPSTPLSEREARRYNRHKERYPAERARHVYDLSQNPDLRPRCSTREGCLCTVTCSSSRLFVY